MLRSITACLLSIVVSCHGDDTLDSEGRQPAIVASQGVGTVAGAMTVGNDGAMRYRIPLAVPPGRAGIQPDLALVFEGTGPNGLVGVGGSLSGLSVISRCAKTLAQDGVRRPIRFATDWLPASENDRYCLDGQRLVAVTGDYAADGTVYHTELETFTKVVSSGKDAAGPRTFTAYTKDGRVLEYGTTADARLESNANHGGALGDRLRLSWLLRRITDRAGNTLSIAYGRSPDPAATSDSTEVVPQQIEYATLLGSAEVPNRRVTFGYETRPDPIEARVGGFVLRTTRRLSEIAMWGPSPASPAAPVVLRSYRISYRASSSGHSLVDEVTECDSANTCMPPTRFSWATPAATFTTVPTGIEVWKPAQGAAAPYPLVDHLLTGDVDGDGRDDLVYSQRSAASTSYTWNVRLSTGQGFAPAIQPAALPAHAPLFPTDLSQGTAQLVDLDGDRRADLALETAVAGGKYVRRFHPGHATLGFGAAWPDTASEARQGTTPATQVAFLDLNDDGVPDQLDAITGRVYKRTLDPTSWGTGETPRWSVFALANPGPSGAACASEYPMTFFDAGEGPRLLGRLRQNLVAGCTWPSEAYASMRSGTDYVIHQDCSAYVDIDGDGLQDIVYLGSVTGRFSKGAAGPSTNQIGPVVSLGAFPGLTSAECKQQDPGIQVVDYDRDGKQDLLLLGTRIPSTDPTALRGAELWRSTGQGFTRQLLDDFSIAPSFAFVGGTAPNFALGNPYLVGASLDANGDGIRDWLVTGATHQLELHLGASDAVTDELRAISDGVGRTDSVSYATLTELQATGQYEPAASACPYPESCASGSTLVVSEERIDRGTSMPLVLRHGYRDHRVSLRGDGALGFASRWVENTETGARVETTFDRRSVGGRYPYIGMPTEELSYVRDGGTWYATRTRYTNSRSAAPGSAVVFPFVASVEVTQHEGPDFAPADPAATPIVMRTRETATYDELGNITYAERRRGIADAIVDTTTTTYANDPATWRIGLPTSIVASSTAAAMTSTRTTTITYDAAGLVEHVVREPDDPTTRLRTTIAARNAWGLPTSIDVSDDAGTTHTTALAYDLDGTFVERVTDPAGHVTAVAHHRGLGVPLATMDPNGLFTVHDYDGFGRLRKTTRPDNTWVEVSYGADATAPLVLARVASDGSASSTRFDRLLRARVQTARGADGLDRRVETTFDEQGRVATVSRPFASGPVYIASRYTYDKLGRLTRIGYHDPTRFHALTYRHVPGVGREIEARDAAGRRTTWRYADTGQLIATLAYPADGMGELTSTVWGPFDLPRSVSHPGGTITFDHDRFGRRVRVVDPDLGQQLTTYDHFGRVASERDGRGVTIGYTYDAIGRLLTRDAPDGTDTFTYDTAPGRGIGLPATETRGAVSVAYAYDDLSRSTRKTMMVDGEAFAIDLAYDGQSRVSSIAYPAIPGQPRTEVRRTYGVSGQLRKVSVADQAEPLWELLALDAAGHVARERLGTVDRDSTFGAETGRLDRLAMSTSGVPIQSTTYAYDPSGLVVERASVGASAGRDRFAYDGARQLTQVITESNGLAKTESYTYDARGNLTASSDLPGCVMEYGVQAGPHALERVTCGGSGVATFRYDGAGNQINGPDREISFTSFNKPSLYRRFGPPGEGTAAMAGGGGGGGTCVGTHTCQCGAPLCVDGSWTCVGCNAPSVLDHAFTYGPTHARVRKQTATTDHLYIDELYERRVEQGVVTHTFYAHAGDRRVAVGQQAGSGSVTWSSLASDRLGSPELVNGEPLGFDAWGQRRSSASWTQPIPFTDPWPEGSTIGFTGHRHDRELDVIDLGGRLYDPRFKHMLAPDPVVDDISRGPSWNHYRYASNQPTALVDPTGYVRDEVKPVDYGMAIMSIWMRWQIEFWSNPIPYDYWGGSPGGPKPALPTRPLPRPDPGTDTGAPPDTDVDRPTPPVAPALAMFSTVSSGAGQAAVLNALMHGHLAGIQAASAQRAWNQAHRPRRVYLLNGLGSGFTDAVLDSTAYTRGARDRLAAWGYVPISIENPTRDQLTAAIEDPDAWGVIYIGHGGGGQLALAQRDGTTQWVGPADIKAPSTNLRFIWTNACYANTAGRAWVQRTGASFFGSTDVVRAADSAVATGSPWLLVPTVPLASALGGSELSALDDALETLPHPPTPVWYPFGPLGR